MPRVLSSTQCQLSTTQDWSLYQLQVTLWHQGHSRPVEAPFLHKQFHSATIRCHHGQSQPQCQQQQRGFRLRGLRARAHQRLFTCVCLKSENKKKKSKKKKKEKKERIRENEHFNFPIKSMPQYESLFAFLH